MSAVIVQDPGSGSVVGFSNNGVIGTPVQLSNQDDTGVLGWEWVIVDRPSGSVAALDDVNSATPQYTPDVAGTYLIELTTYTDAGRTTLDDTDQTATGVPLAGIFNVDWRIPAATETVEASATRGWAVEVNEILKEAAKHLYVGHFDSPITAAQSPYSPQSYETVPVDTTGGAVTVDLPAVAAANKGHRILVQDVGRAAAQITIAPNGSDTIAGAASAIAIAGTGLEGDFRWLQSDGSGGWDLVGGIAVVALQDLESVLTEGNDATDIGITNLGGASVTAGQALTFLGEVDVQRQTVTVLDTSGGNTRLHAPTGQVVQFQVNSAPIADLYAAAGVYGLSFYGDIGTTAAVFVNKPTTAINGPNAGMYAAQGGDGGATDGGNSFLRPGAAGSAGGGTAGRAQLLDSTATERFAVAATGTLEASAALDFLGIEIDLQRQGASVLKTAGANSLAWHSGGTLAATFTQVVGVPGIYPSAQNFAQWLIQPLAPSDDLGPTAGAGAAVRYSGGNARTGSGADGGAAWVQGGNGDGAGADGDAGIRNAAGTPRIYHDASANTDKIGDLSGGSVLETTATAVQLFVASLEFGSSVVAPTLQQLADSASDATGDTMSVLAQSVTGGGTTITGATLLLRGGSADGGTATTKVGGNVNIRPGNGDTEGNINFLSGGNVAKGGYSGSTGQWSFFGETNIVGQVNLTNHVLWSALSNGQTRILGFESRTVDDASNMEFHIRGQEAAGGGTQNQGGSIIIIGGRSNAGTATTNLGGYVVGKGGLGDSDANHGAFVIRTAEDTDVIKVEGGSGTEELGFFGAQPLQQPSSTGQTGGFTAGAGTGVNDDSTFTGGVSTRAYTIGDVVRHLKNLGLLATA